MKKLDRSTMIIALSTLLLGLGLGWLFFAGGNESYNSEHQHTTQVSSEWTCSMHPQIRQKEPGDCPICGMELIPVNDGGRGDENPLEIKMSPTAMQLASVQTAIVNKTKPVKKLRLTGKVQADESTITSQTTHISGRIEKLLLNTTGEYVKKGQIIAYIYSPELVTAQKELFEAQKIANSNPQLLQAAKEKLKNWKLTNRQIESILASGKPIESFPILADRRGIVLTKRVNLGDHVMQGAPLYEIANLNRVWLLFDVYESDMPWVKVGDEVTYSIQSLPGREYTGKVSFIDPVIDPKTRVAKARIVTPNSNGELKPEMFATGIIKSPVNDIKETIVVPKSALMWTGKKSVVYIKTSDANGIGFVMKEVMTGASLGDEIIVLEGLNVGDEIAIHGTFSIDAAAQLAGKPSMMNPEGGTVMTGHNHGNMTPDKMKEGSPPNHSSHSKSITISKEARNALLPVYQAYLKLKESLADDDFSKVVEATKFMHQELNKVNMSVFKGETQAHWMSFQNDLNSDLQVIQQSTDIKVFRRQFLALSDDLITMTNTFGNPFSQALYVQHCPMANDNKGGDWLSLSDDIKNPYFGAAMLTCGEVTESI